MSTTVVRRAWRSCRLGLVALLAVAAGGGGCCCTKNTTKCTACFVDDSARCEAATYGGKSETQARWFSALRLCEGGPVVAKRKPIPPQHADACEQYLKVARPSLKNPPDYVPPPPPADHVKVTCEHDTSYESPFRGCGAFN